VYSVQWTYVSQPCAPAPPQSPLFPPAAPSPQGGPLEQHILQFEVRVHQSDARQEVQSLQQLPRHVPHHPQRRTRVAVFLDEVEQGEAEALADDTVVVCA
jgi:hypothetical protein